MAFLGSLGGPKLVVRCIEALLMMRWLGLRLVQGFNSGGESKASSDENRDSGGEVAESCVSVNAVISSGGRIRHYFKQLVWLELVQSLEQEKADEEKEFGAIDYDAPITSNKKTIGLGAKIGASVAVLVFALGDFLPSGRQSRQL